MKRNMKLICKILSYVEGKKLGEEIQIPKFENYPQCEIDYHVQLCDEAGYLEIVLNEYKELAAIHRMTWAGHEKLEQLRSE